ncbi:MAG: SDR family oxidoreductase [Rhizobacter sp.]|nr:SDR family oxidoreductase [Ferruginibacter sp.]
MKHVLLLGGTGKTGRLLTTMALDAGLYVTVLVSNPASINITSDHLEVIEGDVLNYIDIEKAVQGQDAVLSTLAKDDENLDIIRISTKKIIRAMQHEKVYRFISLSSIGAGSTKTKAGLLFRFWLNITGKRNFFETLTEQENLLQKSQLHFTIIQAGTLTGFVQKRKILKTVLPHQIEKGFLFAAKKPGRSQLAAFMLNELLNPSWIREIICVHN